MWMVNMTGYPGTKWPKCTKIRLEVTKDSLKYLNQKIDAIENRTRPRNYFTNHHG